MSGIHNFDVAQFVPQCLLECVCRGMDGRSMVVDCCWRSNWVLNLALSNVAVHWTVKIDLCISKNCPIVDIRRSRKGGGVHRMLSGNGDLRDVGVEVEDSITLEGPPGDHLRATKWSSKVSRRYKKESKQEEVLE